MINVSIRLKNPFSNRWKVILSKSNNLSATKAAEINLYKTPHICNIEFDLSIRQDHAGIRMSLGFLGYDIEFTMYDVRHWNYKSNSWD